jgi:hypothetical protein
MNEEKAVVEVIDSKLSGVVPSMNMSVPAKAEFENKLPVVSDEALVGMYREILTQVKEDTNEISTVLDSFVNMVINEGDSSGASKEALVNLLKMKADQADKATKIADLMTRIHLKEKDTFPRYMAAQQNNTINIGDGGSKRTLLEAIAKAQKVSQQQEKA